MTGIAYPALSHTRSMIPRFDQRNYQSFNWWRHRQMRNAVQLFQAAGRGAGVKYNWRQTTFSARQSTKLSNSNFMLSPPCTYKQPDHPLHSTHQHLKHCLSPLILCDTLIHSCGTHAFITHYLFEPISVAGWCPSSGRKAFEVKADLTV